MDASKAREKLDGAGASASTRGTVRRSRGEVNLDEIRAMPLDYVHRP